MTKLVKSIKKWRTECFPEILKSEISDLGINDLPIQDTVSPGAQVLDNSDIEIIVLNIGEDELSVQAKIGIMFLEVLGGYCCGDEEPMVNNAYCEMNVIINKATCDAQFIVFSQPQAY